MLKAFVSVALLGVLAYQLDLAKFGAIFSSAHLLLLGSAVLVHLFTVFLSVSRWRSILANFEISIKYTDLIKITFIGNFFNMFLPSAIGGDFFRAFYLARRKARGMSTTLTTTMLERSAGLFALLAIGAVSALTHQMVVQGFSLLHIFALLIAGYLAVNAALFHPKIHAMLNRLLERFHLENMEQKMELVYRGLNTLIRNHRSIAFVLVLSLVIQLGSVVFVWIAAKAIAIQAPFVVFLVFIPLINLSIMVPLTINGFGLRESLYFLLFTQIGLEDEKAVALSLLNALVVMIAAMPGGIVYSLYKKRERFDEAVAKSG